MSQAQRTERVERHTAAPRPVLVMIEVDQPVKRETFSLLAQTPGVRVLCIEEPPMK